MKEVSVNKRLVLSGIVLVVAVVLLILIQRGSAITNADAALLSTVNSDEAYMQSQQSAGTSTIGVTFVTIVVLLMIWAKDIRGLFMTLTLVSMLLLAACGGETNKKVVTRPNEITFMIKLNGDNSDQAVVGDVPLVGNAAFWTQNKVNLREVEITQYCYKPNANATTGCQYRDAVLVVTVDTSSVNAQWIAPPVIEGEPFPDMSNAFSMQSLEPGGGSTGVYVGAQLIAHIKPEDAALYLASYGYGEKDERGTYPARSLVSVIETEIDAQIQTDLNNEYGRRSVAQQNADMATMFETVKKNLITIFGAKGITIDSFGFRDGNVYENPAIQQGIDSDFERQRLLLDTQGDATRQAIVDQQQINSAYAQATGTTVSAESAANAQRLQAEALADNPEALALALINKWNGQGPSTVYGGNVTSPMYYPAPIAPTATPVASS